MNRWIAIPLSLAVLGLSSPSAVLAANNAADANRAHAEQAMSVMFQNGGRDAASRERMNESTRNFDLALSISGKPAGEHWGDVEVQIFDGRNKNIVTQRLVGGPLLYLGLPEGSYRVIARDSAGKEADVREVKVSPDRPVPLDLHMTS